MRLRQLLFRDRVFSGFSWLIVGFLLWAVVSLWLFPPTAAGPVAGSVGILTSQIFYSVLYFGEAGLLAYAKLAKKKRLRKFVLLLIYLTGVFTFLLALSVVGFHWRIVDNFAFSLLAGACWLHWKSKTEYINQNQFKKIIEPMITEEFPSVVTNVDGKHKK